MQSTEMTNHLMSFAFAREEKAYTELWENPVKIFTADTTNERGQYALLSDVEQKNHLLSFAYKSSEQYYSAVWEKGVAMNIHLAATAGEVWAYDLAGTIPPRNTLLSYAYKNEGIHSRVWNSDEDKRARVIIDSGAFTAFTTGKVMVRDDYLSWAKEFEARWKDKLDSLHFMNLDVIGDAEKSEENQEWFEARGFFPLPIVTTGASLKMIRAIVRKYDYFAIGGIVGTDSAEFIKFRLDQIYSEIMKEKNATGRMVKTHLLGVTTPKILYRYPAYSADSSSWTGPLRFGQGRAAGLNKIPRYKESPEAMQATLHALRHEILRYKAMEKNATYLWEKRGIKWND